MRKVLIAATIGGFLPVTERDNAKLLIEMGCEVHYAANFQNKAYEYDGNVFEELGIICHQVDFSKNPFHLKQLLKCIRELKRILVTEQIELVHCHTPVGGVAARIAAHLIRKKTKTCPKVIYTAHGFHFYEGAPVLNWLLYYPVEHLLSKWTDCIVTVNGEDYQRAQKMLCPKCVRIPGVGIDLDRFHPVEIQQSEKFCVVSVGELNKNKNHSVVIKAIAALQDRNIKYEIYGNGPLKTELQTLICSLGLEKQVSLKGFHLQIEQVLQKADLVVFPSIREGLGLAALEAMACGVPLITSDNRGSREYMVHQKNGIVCAYDDVESFANAIAYIKEHPLSAMYMVQEGFETVQRFSIEETRMIMRNVYEEI